MKKHIFLVVKLGVVSMFVSSCQFDNKIVESSYSNQYYVIDKAADIPFTITMPKNFNPLLELDDVENFTIKPAIEIMKKKAKIGIF